MTAAELLRLLQTSDSIFPVGAYAYSDGLEAAVQTERLTTAADLAAWLAHFVDNVFVTSEGLALLKAYRAFDTGDWTTLDTIDRELTALRPSASGRASSAAIGRRYFQAAAAAFDASGLADADARLPAANAPVAYAIVARTVGIAPRDALLAFGYTRVAGMVSAALRLMSIGQQQAQHVLARAVDRLPASVDRIVRDVDRPLRSFSPLVEVCQMNHRHLYSRLFRS